MRILVPVAGTPECESVVPLAQRLAGELDGDIHLLHVVVHIDAFSGLRYDPDILRLMDDASRYLNELASRFQLPPDRTACLVTWSDNAAREIIDIAKNEDVDLIVMGSRCKGWLQRLLRGSVYSEVVGSSPCPVLAVPLRTEGVESEADRAARLRRQREIIRRYRVGE